MRITDLAKEFNTTDEVIIATLKSLKLKAKGSQQELNAAVVTVLRSELGKKDSLVKIKKVIKSEGESKEIASKADSNKKVSSRTKAKTTAKPKTVKVKKTTKKEKIEKEISTEKKTKTVKTSVTPKAKPKKSVKRVIKSKPSVISDEPFVPVKPLPKKRKKTPVSSKEVLLNKLRTPVKEQKDNAQNIQIAKEQVSDLEKKEGIATPTTTPPDQYSSVEEQGKITLEDLEVRMPISVKELAVRLQEKTSNVFKKLLKRGIFVNINQNLEEDVVKQIVYEFGFNFIKAKTQEEQILEIHKTEEGDPTTLKARAPVVTFMGHVDHGKTSLLDKIQKSKIADREHGGITQHIGAYCVELPKGRITFLDTPGHEAFTAMRARGAHITDLVVVVVAADEGIMPQTDEAIDHARAADVPIVVAINKIDKRNADIDRVKKQLGDRQLTSEDWGGKTIAVGVSAVTGEGVDELLDMILLEAELLELKANYEKRAYGIVVEAHLSHGKGAVSSVIVQNGILKEGDFIIAGPYYGKIRAMFDDRERMIKEAGPSMPAEILGLQGIPEAGEIFYVVNNEKQAKEISLQRQQQIKTQKVRSSQRLTLEDLYSQIQEGKIKELNIIIKSDVQGSLEALKDSLTKIPNDQVQLRFIHTGIGEINVSDVLLAEASTAIIIGFHVDIGNRAKEELEKHPVDVRTYRIIYDAVNDIRNALEGLLEPKTRKKFLSRLEVRQVFKLSKAGIVAGCYVQKGKVRRKANIDIVKNGEIVYSGIISSLKRFKDDVREVGEGFECGVTVDGYGSVQSGDIIEVYDLEKIARRL